MIQTWKSFNGQNVSRPSIELWVQHPIEHVLGTLPADKLLAVVVQGSLRLHRLVLHQVADQGVRLEQLIAGGGLV